MTKNKLGERLKERREELMMTQKDIADNIGVAVSTIQRYESGKIKDIKLPVIRTRKPCRGWYSGIFL